MRSAKEAFGFSLTLLVIAVAVKLATAYTFGFGLDDVRRFEAAPFGSDVDDTTPAVMLTWSRGDGMAFYSLAGDLDADGPARFLPPDPAYRMIRIGYSVAARAISLIPGLSIAAGLTLVNLGAVAAMGWMAPRLVATFGDRALLLYLNPAIWLAVAFDGSGALGISLLLVALASGRRGALLSAGLLGVTRPSLAVALPSTRFPLATTGIALSAAIALQVWIATQGIAPTDGAGNLTLPLLGYVQSWTTMSLIGRLFAVVVVAGAFLAIWWAFGSNPRPLSTRLSLIGVGTLVLLFAPQVVDHPENLLRAAAALPIVLVLACCAEDAASPHSPSSSGT